MNPVFISPSYEFGLDERFEGKNVEFLAHSGTGYIWRWQGVIRPDLLPRKDQVNCTSANADTIVE